MEKLYVRMLGGFSVSTASRQISYTDNRSKRMWTLLAYLIYHRHRVVSQEELMELLWGDGEQGANPAGALKTTLYRVRALLDGLWPSAGYELILSQNGGYLWNSEAPLTVDVEQFDMLCRREGAGGDAQNQRDFEALRLYQGDFLAHVSSDSWVIPIAAYYRNYYMQCLLRALPVLMEQERYSEVAELCRIGSIVEPFQEEIQCFMMWALINMGDMKGAADIYDKFSERLLANFGIMPTQEMRALYYEAIKTNNDRGVPFEVIREQLLEDCPEGALICEYDFFRVLYRFIARFMERSGITTHIALLSVTGRRDKELSRRKMEGAMENLEEQIRLGLRRGDCAARCSASQYIILLPQANYENSCMVCERIQKAYYHKHPHSDAGIQYAVYAVVSEDIPFQIDKA